MTKQDATFSSFTLFGAREQPTCNKPSATDPRRLTLLWNRSLLYAWTRLDAVCTRPTNRSELLYLRLIQRRSRCGKGLTIFLYRVGTGGNYKACRCGPPHYLWAVRDVPVFKLPYCFIGKSLRLGNSCDRLSSVEKLGEPWTKPSKDAASNQIIG